MALVVKNLPANAGDTRHWFDLWVGKIPWMRTWQPTPVFSPGEFHCQASLAGYNPQGHQESDRTEVDLAHMQHCKELGRVLMGVERKRHLCLQHRSFYKIYCEMHFCLHHGTVCLERQNRDSDQRWECFFFPYKANISGAVSSEISVTTTQVHRGSLEAVTDNT